MAAVALAATVTTVPAGYQQIKEEEGEREGKNENKKQQKRGGLVIKLGAFLSCFLNTPKLQGLRPVWVQLPKELSMRNTHKNIKIARPRSRSKCTNEQYLQLKQNSSKTNLQYLNQNKCRM
jgi:hypothetical protein